MEPLRRHHQTGLLHLKDCPFKTELERKKRLPLCLRSRGLVSSEELLRKEVIQPHLPIRLPCYDFTPIIYPTFGGWLPCGLPHRLRVL